MHTAEQNTPPVSLDENLKKALTELLMLYLLSQRDYYAGELTAELNRRSSGALSIVFPYSAIYRLQQTGCIFESDKHIAPDGRRRQYFRISDVGRAYLTQLLRVYRTFIQGIEDVLQEGEK